MNYYLIRNREMPWGDYGNILFSGILNDVKTVSNPEKYPKTHVITRDGNYIPEICSYFGGRLVIADFIRQLFVENGISGVDEYYDVVFDKLVNIDWTSWDMDAEDPKIYPAGDEPYNYFTRRKHNEKLESNIKCDYFSLILKVDHNVRLINLNKEKINGFFSLKLDGEPRYDIFKSENMNFVIISERLKELIENNTRNCVRFFEIHQ